MRKKLHLVVILLNCQHLFVTLNKTSPYWLTSLDEETGACLRRTRPTLRKFGQPGSKNFHCNYFLNRHVKSQFYVLNDLPPPSSPPFSLSLSFPPLSLSLPPLAHVYCLLYCSICTRPSECSKVDVVPSLLGLTFYSRSLQRCFHFLHFYCHLS